MDFINTINWETFGYAIITLLTASGVTMSWLKKMCQKIESTNLRVEEHRDEIREILARMNTGITEMEKLIAEYKSVKK
jgi:CHASE3 domain sensor protein